MAARFRINNHPDRSLFSSAQSGGGSVSLPGPALLVSAHVSGSGVDDDLARHAASMTVALVDVIGGARNIWQVEERMTDTAQQVLRRLRRAFAGRAIRATSIRVQCPDEGVLEVSASVWDGKRYRALAVRWTRTLRGWTCNRLEMALETGAIQRAAA
ncbi:MAG: Rv3235 family protein [Propionibacteriaceae bacterium]|jgi:hypothetical protein|nr:Rv3235 family protein [Propionibacteriaceae bacterium]